MNAKLYDRFISDLELKGYAKRSINSYVKSGQGVKSIGKGSSLCLTLEQSIFSYFNMSSDFLS